MSEYELGYTHAERLSQASIELLTRGLKQADTLVEQLKQQVKSLEAQLAQTRKAHEQNKKHHDVFRDVLKEIAKPPSGARADYHVDIARLYADLAYPPPKAEGT